MPLQFCFAFVTPVQTYRHINMRAVHYDFMDNTLVDFKLVMPLHVYLLKYIFFMALQ